MSRPWMPFYIAEYLADTGHLNTTQHGAYCLLIMHYWRLGKLPEDDRQLANITKLPMRIWFEVKPVLQDFFFDGWKHKRIEYELERQEVITTKRSIAGQKGGNVTANARTIARGLRQANARQVAQQIPKQTDQQLLGKRVAVTITKISSSSETESEGEESPQGAIEEEQIDKPPPQLSRKEFDERLEAKRRTSA